jgi:hypothetical protein
MNQRVNTKELAANIPDEDDVLDVETAFAPDTAMDALLDAMRDPKRYSRSNSLATMNKFAKMLEIAAAELVARDEALRAAYAKLQDARAHDEFMESQAAMLKSLRGGSFDIGRPKPKARRRWFW